MKLFTLTFLLFVSLTVSAQPDATEMQSILTDIAKPISEKDTDKLFKHVVFPFEVGDKEYSQSQLKAAFDDVFVGGTSRCLNDAGSYQMALPDNHEWYMAVCFAAPAGYEVAVYTFKKKNNVWMLDSIDLQGE